MTLSDFAEGDGHLAKTVRTHPGDERGVRPGSALHLRSKTSWSKRVWK